MAVAGKVSAGLENPERGAATTVWRDQLEGRGGVYCEDADVALAVPADYLEPRGVRPWAREPALAERPCGLSESWTGVTFPG